MSYFTYYILDDEEHQQYEDGYKLFVKTLESTAQQTVHNIRDAMKDLSEVV